MMTTKNLHGSITVQKLEKCILKNAEIKLSILCGISYAQRKKGTKTLSKALSAQKRFFSSVLNVFFPELNPFVHVGRQTYRYLVCLSVFLNGQMYLT